MGIDTNRGLRLEIFDLRRSIEINSLLVYRYSLLILIIKLLIAIDTTVALKAANVSISLRGASSAATDAAQIVLMKQNLNRLDCRPLF